MENQFFRPASDIILKKTGQTYVPVLLRTYYCVAAFFILVIFTAASRILLESRHKSKLNSASLARSKRDNSSHLLRPLPPFGREIEKKAMERIRPETKEEE